MHIDAPLSWGYLMALTEKCQGVSIHAALTSDALAQASPHCTNAACEDLTQQGMRACQNCRVGRLYRDAKRQAALGDKTCPART
jgi:hypothetical protein